MHLLAFLQGVHGSQRQHGGILASPDVAPGGPAEDLHAAGHLLPKPLPHGSMGVLCTAGLAMCLLIAHAQQGGAGGMYRQMTLWMKKAEWQLQGVCVGVEHCMVHRCRVHGSFCSAGQLPCPTPCASGPLATFERTQSVDPLFA